MQYVPSLRYSGLWDVTLYHWVNSCWHFTEFWCLHHQWSVAKEE